MSQPDSPVARRQRPFALLGSELALVFRRRRTWAMLGALALVPILIAVAVRLTTGGDSGGPAFLGDITNNGLFVSFTALTVSIPLFLPLTVGVVAGDTVAGEASHGTLRYLLVAPTGRLRFILVKYVGAVAFCLAATLVIVLVGAAIGALLSLAILVLDRRGRRILNEEATAVPAESRARSNHPSSRRGTPS